MGALPLSVGGVVGLVAQGPPEEPPEVLVRARAVAPSERPSARPRSFCVISSRRRCNRAEFWISSEKNEIPVKFVCFVQAR